ncbi:MAG: hypothetical protein PF503_18730 [Desulfobacula sp.]|jgi:hypothetical protein|nr:hypothetical protein [Desulfobacula sp.]
MNTQWKEYLDTFEKRLFIPMFEAGNIQSIPVPLHPGKLHGTPFGEFIGSEFEYGDILSFNYYGLFKNSNKINEIKATCSLNQNGRGWNIIQAPVLNFSSVKIDHLEYYCKDLLLEFVSFKKFLVSLRWGK